MTTKFKIHKACARVSYNWTYSAGVIVTGKDGDEYVLTGYADTTCRQELLEHLYRQPQNRMADALNLKIEPLFELAEAAQARPVILVNRLRAEHDLGHVVGKHFEYLGEFRGYGVLGFQTAEAACSPFIVHAALAYIRDILHEGGGIGTTNSNWQEVIESEEAEPVDYRRLLHEWDISPYRLNCSLYKYYKKHHPECWNT